jgi:hypothetical protein
MRNRLILALAAAALYSAPVQAQPARFTYSGVNPGWMDVEMLLQNSSVLQALKLDGPRSLQARQTLLGPLQKYTTEIPKVFTLPKDKQKARELELLDRYQDDQYRALAKVLSADQLKRLKEIQVRVANIDAFAQPWVQKAIGLSNKQKEDIETIAKEFGESRARDDAAFADPLNKLLTAEQLNSLNIFKEWRGKADALTQPAMQSTLRMTAGQKKQLNALAKDLAALKQRDERLEEETLTRALDILATSQRTQWDTLAGRPFRLGQWGGGSVEPRPPQARFLCLTHVFQAGNVTSSRGGSRRS